MKIIIKLWIAFSNLYWRRKKNGIVPFYDYYDNKTIATVWVRKKAAEMYKKFEYTYDKIDNILPPDTAYCEAYKDKLKDDCDGFASLMYHILHKNYEALKLENLALFCIIPLELKTLFQSHVVLAYKREGIWYVIDYDLSLKWDKTLCETMESYWSRYFRNVIKAETTKAFCTSFQYDYAKQKWELAEIKN